MDTFFETTLEVPLHKGKALTAMVEHWTTFRAYEIETPVKVLKAGKVLVLIGAYNDTDYDTFEELIHDIQALVPNVVEVSRKTIPQT